LNIPATRSTRLETLGVDFNGMVAMELTLLFGLHNLKNFVISPQPKMAFFTSLKASF
jgi:hypothetical protein